MTIGQLLLLISCILFPPLIIAVGGYFLFLYILARQP